MYFTKTAYMVPLLIVGLGLTVNGYSQSFLTNGLVAYYPFNGNAHDATGNGHNGTVNGSGISGGIDRFGYTNKSFHFAGGGYVSVTPTPLNVNLDYSISFWCYGDKFSGDRAANFLSTGLEGSGCLNIRFVSFQDPQWQFLSGWSPGTPHTGANGGDFTGGWNQLCFVKSGNTVNTFIGGSPVGTSALLAPASDVGSLWFGRHELADGAGLYDLIGFLDDIRIYNRALSTSEVQELYVIECGPRLDLIKAVKPSFRNLTLTTNYQMQISADLSTWTNYGAAFTATSTNMVWPQYFDVDNWNSLFFRLQASP